VTMTVTVTVTMTVTVTVTMTMTVTVTVTVNMTATVTVTMTMTVTDALAGHAGRKVADIVDDDAVALDERHGELVRVGRGLRQY
jgi:hypothetical protein